MPSTFTATKLTAVSGGTFHIYADESSQDGNHKYMAIGATFLRQDAAKELAGEITAIAGSVNPRFPLHEFHWTEMQKVHLTQYKALVSLFAEAIHMKRLRYHCVVIHNREINIRKYSKGDEDLSLLKLTFGPVYSFASKFGPYNRYVVFPDDRKSKYPTIGTLCALNNRAKTEFGVDARPFKNFIPTGSERSRIIQATDVITGIITYEKNGHHLKEGRAAHKAALWEHAKLCIGLDTFATANRGFLAQRFKIADFDFTKAKPPH